MSDVVLVCGGLRVFIHFLKQIRGDLMQDFINCLSGLNILNQRTASIAFHVDNLPVTYRERVILMVSEHLLMWGLENGRIPQTY